MITGIKLPIKPYMKNKTIKDILVDLDVLGERLPKISHKSITGTTINRRTFIGENFITTMVSYSIPNDSGYVILEDLYSLISEVLPDFIFSVGYKNQCLIYSFPRFNDYKLDELFESLMGEIQRVTVFLLKVFGSENRDQVKTLLKEYVDLCIEY